VGRAVAIVKMRNSNHVKGLWAFTITERGFEIQDKVKGVTGLLGWSALRGQNEGDMNSRGANDQLR
jgi:hydrogenase maturation factor